MRLNVCTLETPQCPTLSIFETDDNIIHPFNCQFILIDGLMSSFLHSLQEEERYLHH